MQTTYRPQFGHDPNGLTAHQLIERWESEKRFLPIRCKQPEIASALIEAMILRQIESRIHAPQCSIHKRDMLLLGTLGKQWVKIARRLRLAEIVGMNKGGFEIHNGIFRCPTPGCFMVGTPGDGAPATL